MLKEMKHRMANSLQLIAGILILKSEAVESMEVRAHLKDTHERIMSIATLEKFLDTTSLDEEVEIEPYLTGLCLSLEKSMLDGTRPITLRVNKVGAGMSTSATAISLGLITAELVINSFKYAFPEGRVGVIVVTHEVDKEGWNLSVKDNGVGITPDPTRKEGLGTTIVRSLARQLGATVNTVTGSQGTKVSIECLTKSPVTPVMRGSSTTS